MKKKQHFTVTELNKMMYEGAPLRDMIDACAAIDIFTCFEPLETPTKEQEVEWRKQRGDYEPDPTVENTSYYVTEPDGTKYFYCGNTRTRVSEFFAPGGKTMDKLIENVVRYAAGGSISAETSLNC